jgi:hypothetical protein
MSIFNSTPTHFPKSNKKTKIIKIVGANPLNFCAPNNSKSPIYSPFLLLVFDADQVVL